MLESSYHGITASEGNEPMFLSQNIYDSITTRWHTYTILHHIAYHGHSLMEGWISAYLGFIPLVSVLLLSHLVMSKSLGVGRNNDNTLLASFEECSKLCYT